MRIFEDIQRLRSFLKAEREANRTIGFVPTMGALHAGHQALINASKAENDLTVCSIYVNPTQFNNVNDLQKYPRTLARDKALLARAGCEAVFVPNNQAMYATPSQITFNFGGVDKILEGEFRPSHFSGVALVVSKLFNIVQPNRAYFGQKDYQQLKIVTQLAQELLFDLEIKSVPIVRERDGLAMSSRNQRLNAIERRKALILYECLIEAKKMLQSGISYEKVRQMVAAKCASVEGVKLEYFTLANSENLLPAGSVTNKTILLIAAFVGEVRLIDNLKME